MKRGLNKHGQFYLVAAMILVVLLIGIIAITNYSKKSSGVGLDEIEQELEIESEQFVNYVTYNELSQEEKFRDFHEFVNDYVDYRGSDKNFYFIFGTKENLTLAGSQNQEATVSIDSVPVIDVSGEFSESIDPAGNNVVIIIGPTTYEFGLKEGENFYYIVSKNINGGEYVISK